MRAVFLLALVLPIGGCSFFKKASVQAALNNVVVAGCNEQTKVLAAFASSIAKNLNCAKPDAINASLTAAMGNVSLCKLVQAPQSGMAIKGVFANLLCPVASAAAVGFMTSQIPKDWECTVSADALGVQSVLTTICESAIPL